MGSWDSQTQTHLLHVPEERALLSSRPTLLSLCLLSSRSTLLSLCLPLHSMLTRPLLQSGATPQAS